MGTRKDVEILLGQVDAAIRRREREKIHRDDMSIVVSFETLYAIRTFDYGFTDRLMHYFKQTDQVQDMFLGVRIVALRDMPDFEFVIASPEASRSYDPFLQPSLSYSQWQRQITSSRGQGFLRFMDDSVSLTYNIPLDEVQRMPSSRVKELFDRRHNR